MKKLLKNIASLTLAISLICAMPVFAFASASQDEQLTALKTGLSLQQIDALIDNGYILSEIETLTPAQVDYILTKDLTAAEKEIYFNAKKIISIFATSAPAGYTKVASVPDNGGTDEWFHPNVNTTETTINTVVSGAKSIAKTIFNTTSTYPTIRYSYYLCGEWGEDAGRENWCHEGIDMRHTTSSTASVYSPISGYVSKSSTSGKYVNIYNENLGITVNIQHLDNVAGTGALVEGSYVSKGQFLGNQNTTDNHVHLQICTHSECTEVHSGRNLDLSCVRPDLYI